MQSPEQAVVVDADPVRLAQVFAQLINHACKYTERGRTIRARMRREGSEAVASVPDNG